MQKFDKQVVLGLKDQINKEMKKNPEKREAIRLTLKENNVVKAVDTNCSEDKLGAWNGYGYERLGKHLFPKNFSKIKSGLKKLATKTKKVAKQKTNEEKKEIWGKRLAKLTGIGLEEALLIAEEKEEYKQRQIEMMEERQADHWSVRRQSLINKMIRKNPLRRIEDEDHAQAILVASRRHKETNYEEMLEEGREKAAWGDIDRSEVKEYARQNSC